MDASSLKCLPDELLLDIVEQLDTARDVANLGSSCRRTHALMRHDGWKTFVRRRFRTLDVPSDQTSAWGTLAHRLAYQHECWEKRGLYMFEFEERAQRRRSAQFTNVNQFRQARQSVAWYPVLDARALRSSHDELAVWGLGEDLITQVKTPPASKKDPGHTHWYISKGHENGYSAGFGDITAISVVDRRDSPEVLLGRANGHLELVQATGDNVGSVVQTLSAPHSSDASGEDGTSEKRKSPGQSAVTWVEWQTSSNMVASSTHSTVALYDLNSVDEETLSPIAHYDVSQDSQKNDVSLVRSVKWMGKDTIACALGGSHNPLRRAQVTPTGLVFSDVAKNPELLKYLASKSEVTGDVKTTVRAIETVGHGTSDSLLLSAWDDGTFRLTDIRTPSPYDAVYRDRWDVYEEGSALLVYGTERFVAGSNRSPKLWFFDFRNPKPYHYSSARPCSPMLPEPSPPPPYFPGDVLPRDRPWTCNHQSGQKCSWHFHMPSDVCRPDSMLVFSRAYSRVCSMAKASDASESFYFGVQGSVMEAALVLAEDVTTDFLKSRTAPPGWHAGKSKGRAPDLIESGVSLCRNGDWKMHSEGDPCWYTRRVWPGLHPQQGAKSESSRLDTDFLRRYQGSTGTADLLQGQ